MGSGKTRMRNVFFLQLLISFLLFSILIIVILSYIFSKISSDNVYRRVSDEYIYTIEQTSNAVENTIEEINQVYTVLNTNDEVYEFLNARRTDPYLNIRAINKARKIKQINSLIDSISLYNNTAQDMLVLGLNYKNEREWIADLLSPEKNFIQARFIIPRKIEYENLSGNPERQVISLVFNETASNGVSVMSSIAVNLDAERIQDKYLEANGSAVFAVGDNGAIILRAGADTYGENVGDEPFFRKITESGGSGSFIMDIGGTQSIVAYSCSRALGWSFVSIRPYATITGAVRQKRNQVVTISVVTLLISSIMAYLVSRRLYSPITMISRIIREYHLQTKDDLLQSPNNELKMILEAVENSLSKIRTLETKNKEGANQLQKDFLRKLIQGEQQSEITEGKLREFGITLHNEKTYAANIKIDSYNKLGDDRRSLIDAAADTMIFNALESVCFCEVVNMYGGEFAVLLQFKDGAQDNAALIKKLQEARDILVKSLEVDITIGLGEAAERLERCNRAYEKARMMVKYRFVFGYNQIIWQALVDERLVSNANYPAELDEKLYAAMKLCKRDEFVRNLDNIISILKNYKYSDAALKLLELELACAKALDQISSDSKKLHVDFEEFLSLQTIEHTREAIIRIFDEYQNASDELNRVKSGKHSKVVEEMKAYINENYSNTGLGAEMLAELSGYSTNYFAKMFKDITGIYLIDYIRQVRINKANALLKDSNQKISEISDMVGFSNTSHFYSAFKKEVGLTPNSFRNLVSGDPDAL